MYPENKELLWSVAWKKPQNNVNMLLSLCILIIVFLVSCAFWNCICCPLAYTATVHTVEKILFLLSQRRVSVCVSPLSGILKIDREMSSSCWNSCSCRIEWPNLRSDFSVGTMPQRKMRKCTLIHHATSGFLFTLVGELLLTKSYFSEYSFPAFLHTHTHTHITWWLALSYETSHRALPKGWVMLERGVKSQPF